MADMGLSCTQALGLEQRRRHTSEQDAASAGTAVGGPFAKTSEAWSLFRAAKHLQHTSSWQQVLWLQDHRLH